MSAIVKTKLKAARDALSNKDWDRAKSAASSALEYDPENYNANVFLGLALFELGETELSEQAYLKATSGNPDQPLAWQGLSKLYEHVQNWEQYYIAVYQLAKLYAQAQDASKCAESLQRLLGIRRDRGTPSEIADTLRLFLPDSPFYSIISNLPPPDASNPAVTTYFAQSAVYNSLPLLEEITAITENDEDRAYEKEVNSRRLRTDSKGLEDTQREVGSKLWPTSKLPALYQEILNHPNASDELRRATEAKLLSFKHRLLYSLPNDPTTGALKESLFQDIEEMVHGIVLLEIPNELAWTLYIEGRDAATIEDYDYELLSRFIKLFPSSDLSQLLRAYFTYRGISFVPGVGGVVQQREEPEDYAATVMDMFPNVSKSLLGHRCIGDVCLREEDFEQAIKVAESGLTLYEKEIEGRGVALPAVKRAFNVTLVISLVQHQPPKHHARALCILDQVLAEDGSNIVCLMNRGYVMQHAAKWGEAIKAFQQVTKLVPDDVHDGLRAREEYAWCMVQSHNALEGEGILTTIVDVLDNKKDQERDKARCWWRLGRARWDLGNQEAAYRCFITALKRLPSYAPAFTSLGIYYSEAASPPDPSRASKCFQKAFQLDPQETDAARRLAEGFAEEQEWDLVEVVARRTIDGEGGLEAESETVTPTRYRPLNAWAWKALGVVELHRQRYPQAIQALQVALRTHVDDHSAWLRLGEAYSKAGRYAAALKALERAQDIDPDDWISSYFLGEVMRQMGQFEEAISAFLEILNRFPSELRVLVSLGQCHLEFGRAQLAAGYPARAEGSFVASIEIGLRSLKVAQGFRRISWKTVADALFSLARLPTLADPDHVLSIVREITPLIMDCSHERISNVISFPITLAGIAQDAIAIFILEIAVATYNYRLALGLLDDLAYASAYHDLGAALCFLARRAQKRSPRESCYQNATVCLKEALRLDPLNARYWSALGTALLFKHPKTAQHAYIRALEIDNKEVSTWCNLGFLYLHYGDAELANEAFYKAQVLDPDLASAWIGQGLVATSNGQDQEALALFEHSTGLPVPILEADIAYARHLFIKLNSSQTSCRSIPDTFFQAFFILDRFCRRRPDDANAQHLFGLVCECIGHLDLAATSVGRSLALLEAEYEETEDPEIERHFAIAHTSLARINLAKGNHAEVQASCQTVLGLLEEAGQLGEIQVSLVIQAKIYLGLACLKSGDINTALQYLEDALSAAAKLTSSEVRGHLVVLVAQTLWALDTEGARNAAKDRLLTSITANIDNLTAVNTLAGMGILTDDVNLVDAALSEILEMLIDQRLSKDPLREVTYLLVQNCLAQRDVAKALSISEKALAAEPTQWKARERLALLQLQRQERKSARALLRIDLSAAIDRSTLRECLPLAAVAETEVDPVAAQKLAQRAVMLTPWNRTAWRALEYARTCGTASK